ncbi:hypothetical protein M527_07015 [Sphingobium indicum IP26]|uniref:Uncharacterized protein n=1 Tax=Sphingobium indicum F2 TaxID=1450518 RepID=A0A8E0WSY2_9SPHN|nr:MULTISPECIES: hypothetical protein [Sphingobium]EPR09871.1 hypothetical protein M527_07015 [Sphingobium indicum IP26]EQB04999.1 hypothetical protein L286_09530 [Sphingobium sp. HDIP04]KER36664.1 hypothetical protein AL00_09320 [Sphingobium indicum F2]
MDGFATSAGTTIALSAAAPATYNEAGYEALTWTTIGKVTDLGEIPSRVYELVTLYFVASRGMAKAKGGYQLGSQTIVYAIDPDDTGQALVDTATDSDSAYSVKINHPQFGAIYARALVMGGPKTYSDVNTASTRSVTIEYTIVSDTEDGVVAVPAD